MEAKAFETCLRHLRNADRLLTADARDSLHAARLSHVMEALVADYIAQSDSALNLSARRR